MYVSTSDWLLLCYSAMKAVENHKICPKKIEVGHCYLAVESSNVSLVLYRVCVVAALATVSEQYEVCLVGIIVVMVTIVEGVLHRQWLLYTN